MITPVPDRWRAVAPYAVVALVALWVTRAFWLPGGWVVGFDTYAYSGPNLEVTRQAVADLRLPLVNDQIFGGVPHLGNPQTASWYPAHLVAQVIDVNRAMGLVVTGHVMLLGVGMVAFTRRLGASRVASAVAGGSLVATGSALTKSVQFEQIAVVAWTPLLLAALHATLTSRRPQLAVAATAVATAAVLVAGHPQLTYQAISLCLALTAGLLTRPDARRRLPQLIGGVTLGLALAAPQLVAAVGASANNAIGLGRTLDDLRSPLLSMDEQFVLRSILGTPQSIDPAVFAGGFENVGYLGVAMTMLAVVGAVRAISEARHRSWAIALAVIAVVALLWAMGPRTIVFEAAYHVIPGFDLARASARWLVVTVTAAAVFVAFGVDAVRDGLRRADLAGVGTAVALSVTLAVAGVVSVFASRTALIWFLIAAVVIGLLALSAAPVVTARRRVQLSWALAGFLALELALLTSNAFPQRLREDEPFTARGTATTEWLAGQAGFTIALTDDGPGAEYQVPGLRPNTNALSDIASIDGYDGGVQITERWATALYRLTDDPQPELPLRNSLSVPLDTEVLGRLGVRHVLLDRARPQEFLLPDWSGPVASDERFTVWENPDWRGESVAWFDAVEIASDRAAADLLRQRAPWYASTALVDDPAAVITCEATPTECQPVALELDRPTPETMTVRTDFSRSSIVVVHQQALPGWEVTIDGEAADLVVVDGLYVGVSVPPGPRSVTFTYSSPFLGATLLLAALAGGLVVALVAADAVAQRRHRRSSAEAEHEAGDEADHEADEADRPAGTIDGRQDRSDQSRSIIDLS